MKNHTFKILSDHKLLDVVISFLGLKESSFSFMSLNKLCLKQFLELFLFHKDGVVKGHSLDTSGRLLSVILDTGRYACVNFHTVTLNTQASRFVRSVNDMHSLRTPAFYGELNKLNAGMYTFWNSMPSSHDYGVLKYLRECADLNEILFPGMIAAMDLDVKYWNNDRIYGDFFVLFERPDGTILVSNDCKKVYLVLGLADSIAKCVYQATGRVAKKYNLHGVNAGTVVSLTLLNWQGKIVYDGLICASSEKPSIKLTKKAIKAYIQAVDKGKLITSISRTPLPLTEASKLKPAPSVKMLLKLKSSLDKLKAMSEMKGIGPTMWVFRRHGYTPRENPNNMISIISSGSGLVVDAFNTKALIPNIEEYIQLLMMGCQAVGSRRPPMIMIDAIEMVGPMKEILTGTGVIVEYYAPPSNEERAESDRTNPALKGVRDVKPGELRCHVCYEEEGVGGVKLMKCSRCQSVRYCSKEHQKLHWKEHKKYCYQA